MLKLTQLISAQILSLVVITATSSALAQDDLQSSSGAYYTLNNAVTVLPTSIITSDTLGNGVSTQILSRQDINGDVGFVWNITLRYQFVIPDEAEILEAVAGKRYSVPNTIEYQTYLAHQSSENSIITQLIDGGTANTNGIFASSVDLEFKDANALTEYIASGAEVDIISAIKFSQVTSVKPDTDEVEQVILDYLATNLITPDAPVLSTYTEILKQHPEIVGRNPAVTISALAKIFDQASITLDDLGNPKLEMPPAFNINFNANLSTPRNIRFTDKSVARGKIKLCDNAEVIILEIGLTGCENIERLIQRFE